LRVLHIISDLRRGGRERQLAILTKYSDTNIENHIIAFHKMQYSFQDEYKLNIIYTKPGKVSRFIDIYKYVKEKKIDLIQTWGNSETLYSLPASKLACIPLLNGSVRHGIRLNKFSQRFRSLVLRLSKYILANSYAGFKANQIKVNNDKHFVVYNGIEEKFFTGFNPIKRRELNSKYNLSDNSLVFISIANFVPYKDYFTPLKACAKLKSKGTSFHYIIIGKGPLEGEIKDITNKLGLGNNVSIYSDNPDIPSLLSVSDIMIHSSLGEGCSNAILEANAAGLIVVASDTGGTKEIINQWDFLYQFKNADELTLRILDAINLIHNDPLVRQKIKSVTKSKFSIDTLIYNYRIIISKILNYNSKNKNEITYKTII
jgi:glycosyltransferase involved in cell wall biosynthesis